MLIRPGQAGDLAQLNDIYNHYVRETPITFDIEPITMAQRTEWFGHYDEGGRHRLLVATAEERLLGYATSSPWHVRRAYETSIETSIYLAPDATGRGVGSALYSRLFDELDGEDIHRAYGGMTIPNPASIALHERFGFERVAYFSEQGRKFGRYWDVALYEKPLG
ncbi:MAG TPA: GNAT family N-acetyltransferase [Acidimicrobiia bacterium]|nr:GNAT family N-acetyltransferase [Acidimicrobiia bacterium]